MRILEVRPEQVICEDNGKITTRPNSPYYSLRFFQYHSKRINYIFSDTSYVMETYDDRIFNCWCKGKRIQLRQDLSENLAVAINHHREFNNKQEYEELFREAYEEQPYWNILKLHLGNVEGVAYTKIGYIVDGSFRVDFKGNAWVWNDSATDLNRRGDGWRSLCIVMQGKGGKFEYDGIEARLPDEYGHMMDVNAITMSIISKIIFLLNPNMDDEVFTNQLSKSLLQRLSNRKEVNKQWKK